MQSRATIHTLGFKRPTDRSANRLEFLCINFSNPYKAGPACEPGREAGKDAFMRQLLTIICPALHLTVLRDMMMGKHRQCSHLPLQARHAVGNSPAFDFQLSLRHTWCIFEKPLHVLDLHPAGLLSSPLHGIISTTCKEPGENRDVSYQLVHKRL